MAAFLNSKKAILINQKGAALVYVIILFSVIFTLSVSVLSLFSSNLKQAKHQESRMEAYYLSYSGALMGFAAITEDSNELLKEITEKKRTYSQDKIKLDSSSKGTINLKAIKSTDVDYFGWVEVTSVGTLDSSGISATSVLYIDPSNTKNIKWKSF